jgi:hypothetical protein
MVAQNSVYEREFKAYYGRFLADRMGSTENKTDAVSIEGAEALLVRGVVRRRSRWMWRENRSRECGNLKRVKKKPPIGICY